ncbi:MAG: hypothetical protein LBU27_09210 [Candidatus Peribacteria bacterium]|nr:hypothetical protein [Candidatus Peribacteria bacterium]
MNLYVEGHRDSAKTTILGIAYECRKICYSKANFLCNLCYDKTKAKAFNFIIANILVSNKRIIDDFGVLYVRGIKSRLEDFLIQSGINEFITTNGIKVKAFGMGEAIR